MQRQNDLAGLGSRVPRSRNTVSLCELVEIGTAVGWEWKMLSRSPKTKAASAARMTL